MKSLTKTLQLYFIPGVVPMVLLILFYLAGSKNLPSVLVLIAIDLLITLPLMLYFIAKELSLPYGFGVIKAIFNQQQCLRFKTFIIIVVFSLVWAVITFQLMKPTSYYLKNYFFNWIPNWFTLEDYLVNSYKYDFKIIKITFFSILMASLLIPIAEEIYFRGFLLLKKEKSYKLPVLRNTILFSAYHLWSPWLFLTRVIATYPIYYFVRQKKNIFLSIITHCMLNIIGDVIFIYPLIFNPTNEI